MSSGFVYTVEKVESVGDVFKRKSRENDELRRENGVYLMLVVGKVIRKGNGRRLSEGFGCLKSRYSRYGLTIKRQVGVSFHRQSALTLSQAVTLPYLRLSQLAFQAIKATLTPTSPLKNYSKGLSKLHYSYLRDCRSAHYRSVSSKTLSLTLVRDFILNVLDAVVTGALSREKAWAWNRIRYIRASVRNPRDSKQAEYTEKAGKGRNSRLEARISIGLSKLQPVYLLKKHSFSCWKSVFLVYCGRKLLKSKAILAVQCMFPLIRARLDAGWREIMTLSREIELKGAKLRIALSKIVAKDAFDPSFKRIQAYSLLKSRQFQALSRAFQRIHSIERLQTAARIQRLYRKLAESSLADKRRATRVQNAARGLGITLRGMTRERLQLAFQQTRLYFPYKSKRISAISPVSPLYSAATLAKAIRRIDSCLKFTLKASFQQWKSHSYSLSVQYYKQYSKYRSNRGSVYTTCPQTMASQREMVSAQARKRADSSSPDYSSSLRLVSELIRSQYGVQAKVEAMLRQSPARSPLRSSVVRGAKERVRGLYVAKVLSRLLGLKWAFGRLGSKKTWGEREKLGVEGMGRGVSNALYRLRSSVFHLLQSLPSRQSHLFSHSFHTLNTHLKHQQVLTLTHTLATWRLNSKVLTQRFKRRGRVLGSVITAAVKRVQSSYKRYAMQYLRNFPVPSYFEVLSALATIRKQARNSHRTALTQALQ